MILHLKEKLLQIVWLVKVSSFNHLYSFLRRMLSIQQNRRVDLVTIGSFEKIPHERRRVVGILARLHPGESPASYVCQGKQKIIQILLSIQS